MAWSVVERHRAAGGKITQRHVRSLREITDRQRLAWEYRLAVCAEPGGETRQLALLPSARPPPAPRPCTCGWIHYAPAVHVRLEALRHERPCQWGAGGLADQFWRPLHLDAFFGARRPVSHQDPEWEQACASS